MRRQKTLVFSLVFASLPLFLPTQQVPGVRDNGKQSALFTVDLGKFGYGVKPNSVRLPKSLEFTSDGHIALSCMTFDDSSASPNVNTSTNRPTHLHVIILDAATGSKIQRQEWSSPSVLARFAVLRNGQFFSGYPTNQDLLPFAGGRGRESYSGFGSVAARPYTIGALVESRRSPKFFP
jgi:hypothetical protein